MSGRAFGTLDASELRREILEMFAEAQRFVPVHRRRRALGRGKPHYIAWRAELCQANRRMDFAKRTCLWCATFIATVKSAPAVGHLASYCSHKCRMAHQWFKKSDTSLGAFQCMVCAASFVARGWLSRRKFCSAKCKRSARLERARPRSAAWRAKQRGTPQANTAPTQTAKTPQN